MAALVDRIPFTKIVTILAICAGVGVGLCGVGMAVGSATHFSGSGLGNPAITFLLIPGGILFWASALGLVLVCLLWAFLAIMKSAAGR